MPSYLSLRDIQEYELGMLLDFDTFCNERNLRYSLLGGTLIGAVRHNGFIPWDDDVDVCMPRPDYETFLAASDKLAKHYRVLTYRNSRWPQPFAKLQDMRISAQEPGLDGVIDGYLWIDIFPYDGVPDCIAEYEENYRTIGKLISFLCNLNYQSGPDASLLKRALRKMYQSIRGGLRADIRTRERIDNILNEIEYTNSYYVASYVDRISDIVLKKSEFEKCIRLPFEGHLLPCMSCYDYHLTATYGNYMKMPPEHQRKTHGFKAWVTDDSVMN